MELQNLFGRIATSPAWRRLEAEALETAETDRRARHAQLAATRAEIERAAGGDLGRLAARTSKALDAFEQAKAALERADLALFAARNAEAEIKDRLRREEARLDRELRATADPRIATAIRDLRERKDAVMAGPIDVEERRATDGRIGGSPFVRYTNDRGRRTVLAAIGPAVYRLEQLALAPADDVPAAIDTIVSMVPWARLEQLESVEGGDDLPPAA